MTPNFQNVNVFIIMNDVASEGSSRRPGSSGYQEDRLTLLVFKDNLSARALQIPLRWITRLGILLGAAALLTLVSFSIAFKARRQLADSSPKRVRELEQKLSESESALQNLQAKATATVAAPIPGSPSKTSEPVPVAPAPPAQTAAQSGFFSFRRLISDLPPAPPLDRIPIRISHPQAFWRGRTLQVQFSIQYVGTDGGNQQGRVLVLTRGPGQLMAYPAEALGSGTDHSLIRLEQGESFSVSRFRAVQASFGPVESKRSLTEVEALIIDPQGKTLLIEKISISDKGHYAAPPAPRDDRTESSKETSETETQAQEQTPAANPPAQAQPQEPGENNDGSTP